MVKCYVCQAEIKSEVIYTEHILLNSLGGKLKSESLICQICSPSFDKIDAALSKQLNFVGLLLNIRRDRGKNPDIRAAINETGEEIFISAGGKPVPIKPTINISNLDEKLHFSLQARDEKQMKEVLHGLKRKYPDLDVQQLLQTAVVRREYLSNPVHYSGTVGGDEAFRAICKMAINFYMYKGGIRDYISHLISYIKDGQLKNCVWHYYPDELTALNGENFNFFHTLLVKGDPLEHILYAYIELFSSFKFLILLSDRYFGGSFEATYSFDVINNNSLDRKIDITLFRNEILEIIRKQPLPVQRINKTMLDLKEAIILKQTDDYLGQLTRELVEDYFKDIPEGSIFDEKMMAELSSRFAEAFVTFMYRVG